jgi:NADH dehydrogenase
MPALTIPRNAPAHVVVLGAGYAGLLAALRLAGKAGGAAQVTLVNDAPHFVERIRLHQVAVGAAVPRRPLARVLQGSGVELLLGRATSVEPATRRVVVEREGERTTLRYDALVYALGSGALHADLERHPSQRRPRDSQ